MNTIGKLTLILFVTIIIATMPFAVVPSVNALPSEVWVDDDYCNGCLNDGYNWNYNAFAKIQDGINAVESPGTVHVAAGNYVENITLKDGVKLLGAGAEVTIINGEGKGSVVVAHNIRTVTRLSGFTITQGAGAGIKINDSTSSLLIEKNSFIENSGKSGAGGISIWHSSPTISENLFSNNVVAVYVYGGSPLIKDNIVKDNSSRCCGVVVLDYSEAIVINNLIVNNKGGGIYITNGPCVIVNNTIAFNKGSDSFGIRFRDMDMGSDLGPVIVNNIIWDNGKDLDRCTATYSDISDGDPGKGNISVDPMFVDTLQGDFRIKPESLCIDIGTNSAPEIPVTDLEGNPRVWDWDGDGSAIVDMGAYECFKLSRVQHDVTPQMIISPSSITVLGENVKPSVRVWNIGTATEGDFVVSCEIELNGREIYKDTQSVIGLSALCFVDLTFAEWTPIEEGHYEFKFYTQLQTDENPENDVQRQMAGVRSHIIYVDYKNTGIIEDGTKEYPYTSIQEGINAAISGEDTVLVAKGTYYENITLKGGVVVRSADSRLTIIDGYGNGPVVTIGSQYGDSVGPDTVLEGFTIQNGSAQYEYDGAGINIVFASPIIRNNIIKNNKGWGIKTRGTSAPRIEDNSINCNNHGISGPHFIIRGNVIHRNEGFGIEVYDKSNIVNNIVSRNGRDGLHLSLSRSENDAAKVINNTIVGNSGAGVRCNPSPSLILLNNIITNNGDYGIFFSAEYNWGKPNSDYNDVWGNAGGDYGGLAESGYNDISTDPIFVDPERNDYHLLSGSLCIDTGIGEEASDIDFEGDIRPVDGDGDGVAAVDIGADEAGLLFNHDVAPQVILIPMREIPFGITVTPKVRVRNIGINNEDAFSVTCEIELADEQIYLDIRYVTGLASLEAVDVIFSDWTPQKTGEYRLNFQTKLAGDDNTDNDTQTRMVNVKASPDAAFTMDITKETLPLRVQFTDLSIGIITDWLWDFGDGYTSTEQNPIHTYTSEGTYSVSLTVSNPDGHDTETKADSISVVNVPPGWSLPEKLTDWIGHPDITVSGEGDVFIICENKFCPYLEPGIYYIENPSGENGPTPELIEDSGSAKNPHAAFDAEETVHVVWQNPYEGKILYTSKSKGGVWLSPTEISSGYTSPAISIDHEDTVHIVWESNWEILYASKTKGGEWTSPVNISNTPSSSGEPDIVVDHEGRVGVVWFENNPYRILYVNKGPNSTWSEPATISCDISGYPLNGSPNIGVDSSGTMHAVWDQNGVFYVNKPLNGEWSDPVMLPRVAGLWGVNTPCLAIDSTDCIHVTWVGIGHSITGYSTSITHAWSRLGSEWSVIRVFPAAGMTDTCVSMVADKEDNLHLVWPRNDTPNYGIWYTSFGHCPAADFMATPTSGTVPLEVQFIDKSEGNPTGWLWDFGYGQTDTERNPTHIYDSPGVYTVTLTISISPGSNKVTKTDYITVYEDVPAPLPSYVVEPVYIPIPQSDVGFGRSIASVGDVDGDGTPDFLVGAHGWDVGENWGQGRAFLFSGATRKPLLTLDNPNPQVAAFFGSSVALAGDLNQDGTPDFIVGAPSLDQGQVFAFNGATGELLFILDNPNLQSGSGFGESLSSAGDVNGDSISDLFIGCGFGQAFLFDGSTGDLLLTLDDPNPQGGSYFGCSVAPVGDVDSDGIPDLIVGCSRDESQSQAFIFSGDTGNLLLTLQIPWLHTNSGFGRCVASAGDINADGTLDWFIGASHKGQAFVFNGSTGGLLLTLNLPIYEGYPFGVMALAPLGDINGDGTPDLLVGLSRMEQAFVFSGATGGILFTLDNPEPQDYAYFGCAVDSADFDNDGISDLLIGAYEQDDEGYANQGRVYVFLSRISADFSIEPKEVNVNEKMQFIDLTEGGFPPYTYKWDLDNDGKIDSTEKNPTWHYEKPGVYSVFLQVTDSRNNTDTVIKENEILPLDIFGFKINNSWTYQRTHQESSYTIEKKIIALDETTFPSNTYIVKIIENGSLVIKAWYEKTSVEVHLLGSQEEGGVFCKFSTGLIEAWYPMEDNDHKDSSASVVIDGYFSDSNVSMIADVLTKEPVVLSFGKLEAYKLRYQLRIRSYGEDETKTFYKWLVPYLGVVKYQDDEFLEELTSFSIGGGMITQETDADADGLKDYQELIIYGTNVWDEDTDLDDIPDGWEVRYNLNPLINDAMEDADGDGFTNLEEYQLGCVPRDDSIYPEAIESCDGKDNDCNGQVDEICCFAANMLLIGQEYLGNVQTADVDFGLDSSLAGILIAPNNWSADHIVRIQLIDPLADIADPNTFTDDHYLVFDVRDASDQKQTAWYIMVEIGDMADPNLSEYYPMLTWDPNAFECIKVTGKEYLYQLRSGLGSTGTLLVYDMLKTNFYQTNPQDGDPTQYFTILWREKPTPPTPTSTRPWQLFSWPWMYIGTFGWPGFPPGIGIFPGGAPSFGRTGYSTGLIIPSFPHTYSGLAYSEGIWSPSYPMTFPVSKTYPPVWQTRPDLYWTKSPDINFSRSFFQTGWFYPPLSWRDLGK